MGLAENFDQARKFNSETLMINKKINAALVFVIFFVFWLTIISNFWIRPILLTISLAIISFLYFIILKNKQDVLVFLSAAILGPIGEIIVSSSGLWKYNGVTFFGIPYWLPFAWGITAVALFKLLAVLLKK